MSGKGIFVSILPNLELAALTSVVSQLKSIMGKAGVDAAKAFEDPQLAAVKRLEDAQVAAANRAAAAQIKAAKLAGDAQVEEARRGVTAQAGLAKAADDRTAAELLAINRLSNAHAKAGQAAKESEQAGKKAATAADEHAAALAGATNATTKYGGALNAMGMAATGAFAVLGGVGVKEASQYEAGLTKIQVATQETTSNIKQLHDGMMVLAPQVGQSLGSLTDASYIIEKASSSIQGLQDPSTRAAGTLNVLKAASQLAAVEGADLSTVVNGLTTTMSDYGIGADKASQVAAKFQVAIGNSKVPIQDFMGSLHTIEPTAMVAGVGMDQVVTMLARMTQNGMSANQATQNLNDALGHMMNALTTQGDFMGELGVNAADLTKQLGDPNVGMIGVINELADAMQNHLDPQGRVVFNTMFENAQAVANLKKEYDGLSPAMQSYADQAKAGTLDKKKLSVLTREGPEAGAFAQYMTSLKQIEGYDPILKRHQDLVQTIGQSWAKLTGTNAGDLVGIMGAGSPENRAATADVLKQVQGAHPDSKGDLEGWAKVTDTLQFKLKDLNASFQAMAVTMGEALLPVVKQFVDIMTGFFGFLSNHKAILDGIILTLGGMATAWVGVKTAMMFQTVWDGMEKGLNLVIGKFGALKTAALEASTTIETTATAEVAAEGTVATAADGVALSLGSVVTTLAALAAPLLVLNAFNDHYNSDHPNQPKDVRSRVAASALAEGANPGQVGVGTLPDANNPALNNLLLPGSGGQAQDRGAAVDHRGKIPGSAGTPPLPTATAPNTPTPFPFGQTDPAAVDQAAGGSGGKKTPAGDKNDPVYIAPVPSMAGSGGTGTGGKNDPWNDYDPLSEAASGGFTLPNIAKMATTFLAELALGNPLGKLQAQKRGDSASDPMYVQDVTNGGGMYTMDQLKSMMAQGHVQEAQQRYDNAVGKYGEGSDQAQRAALGLTKSQQAQQNLATSQAIGSGSGSLGSSQDQVALAIIQEGLKRGLNRDQIVAGLDVAKLESNYGANPMSRVHQNQSGTDVQGIFQQDPSYSGNHNDPHNAAGQYFDRFIQRGGLSNNPYAGAVKVQQGTYGGGYVQGQNQGSVYDRLAPQAGVTAPIGSPGGSPGFPGQGIGGPNVGFAPSSIGPQGGGKSMAGVGSGALAGTQSVPQSGGTSQQGGSGNKSGGFGVSGGIIGSAESAAATAGSVALGGMDGGASSAATQIATQEANRFAGYLGQLGGIAAEGILETLTLNDSSLADPSKSLPGKVIFGLAGAHPSGPNQAGSTQPAMQPNDDKTNQKNNGDQTSNGPLVHNENVNIYNADQGGVSAEQNRQMMQATAANPI